MLRPPDSLWLGGLVIFGRKEKSMQNQNLRNVAIIAHVDLVGAKSA